MPLISVANIHQAGLAAAAATAKDSILACAVISSLIKYTLNISSSPFFETRMELQSLWLNCGGWAE